jgi:hypothetical protein
MRDEVELIAHSCGVLDPHSLTAEHAFIINQSGRPEKLDFIKNERKFHLH